MIVWRLSRHAELNGLGGLMASGRWHSRGHRVIYTSVSPAGAVLEVLAGLDVKHDEVPEDYQLLRIRVDKAVQIAPCPKLPPHWSTDVAISRSVGDEWLAHGMEGGLRVPSVLVVQQENVLLAPERLAEGKVRVETLSTFCFDPRLLHAR